ncbi:MAG: hypothetical protein WC349_05335 [Patescibacteria group bacterium]|jgi:hypothetical protein
MTAIHYNRQEKSRGSYNGNGRKNTFKPAGPICPFANERLGSNDQGAVNFLVNGKSVPVRISAFIDLCTKSNLPLPYNIGTKKLFNIEEWALETARKLATKKPREVKKEVNMLVYIINLLGFQRQIFCEL